IAGAFLVALLAVLVEGVLVLVTRLTAPDRGAGRAARAAKRGPGPSALAPSGGTPRVAPADAAS
ncbi:ABC transporter permease, partial [Streptomyces sp. SM8]